MFSKVALLATLALALSVSAAENKCNTGELTCCNQAAQSNTAQGAHILSLVGLAAQGITGMVGSNCSPITGAGIGSGGSCQSQPMCCEKNNYHGAVVVGCTPVNVKL